MNSRDTQRWYIEVSVIVISSLVNFFALVCLLILKVSGGRVIERCMHRDEDNAVVTVSVRPIH